MDGWAWRGVRRLTRAAHDAPAALTVTVRHLVRGSDHVGGLPQPWRADPAYAAALTALRAGHLTRARDLADNAGPAGRLLARHVAGELAALTPAPADLRPPARRPDARSGPAPGRDRVLHLVSSAQPEVVAGYTVRTQAIARAQQQAGIDARVVTRLGFPVTWRHLGTAPDLDVDGVPHHRTLPLRLPLHTDAALRAEVEHTARLVGRLRPTVLHAHSNHLNGQVGLALRRRFGIPLVYEVRGLLEETWLSRSPDPDAATTDFYRLSRAAETSVMRAADVVVTLSTSLREEIVRRGVPPERVHVVPNCVDAAWLSAPPPPRPDRPLTVGQIGTLNGYEGLDVLVDAVSLSRAAGVDLRLRVVGDGPARGELEKRTADRGIADATTFTGRVAPDAVPAEHRRLDLFCLPRLDLPVTRLVPPLKPLEAMALGTAVVASDLAPLRELIGDDRGVLVPPGDPRALAAALTRLDDPATRDELGSAARRWVGSTRTWTAAAETYAELYTAIRGETR